MDIEMNGEHLSLSGRLESLLFQSTMARFDSNNRGSHLKDQTHSYLLNNYGYRSPAFKEGTPLLIGGCSYTYGIGLPEDAIWGVQLAKKMGVDYANVSMPGVSAGWVVDQVLAYCREFGNPEYMVLTFPSFFRGTYIKNTDVVVPPDYTPRDDHGVSKDLSNYTVNQLDAAKYPKISKRPYEINDVTPPELPIYETMRSIRIIEQYCKAANIKLRWGFFDGGSEMISEEIERKYGFSNRVDLKRKMWRHEFSSELYGSFLIQERGNQYEHCHEDQRKDWGDVFDLGVDRHPGLENAHPGVHPHIHIAEEFYESLKMIGLDNE
jgi:hypothetical protein